MSATSHPYTAWQGWARGERGETRRRRISLQERLQQLQQFQQLQLQSLRGLQRLKAHDGWRLQPEITVYTPSQLRHLIRLDVAQARGVGPGAAGGVPTVPLTWVPGSLRQIPFPDPPPFEAPAPTSVSSSMGSGTNGWWMGAARGLPVGAALLALLVLLARGAERCFDRTIFKVTRRRSEEWPTPNVLATNAQQHCEDFPSDPPAPLEDPPPPYSQCHWAQSQPTEVEDPPPPYEACYAAYVHKAGDVPAVHFYDGRRRPLGSSLVVDTGQEDRLDSRHLTGHESDLRLVFVNGRVVPDETLVETRTAPEDTSISIAGSAPAGEAVPRSGLAMDSGSTRIHVV